MKICLKKNNNMCSCNEFDLVICADGGIGKQIRRNLPKCICGDGIKINIIVTGCDGVLEAPALPCNNLFVISSPIRVIRKNPCCKNKLESCCDDNDINNFDFNRSSFSDSCNKEDNHFSKKSEIDEFAIIIRSFNPAISEFLCEFPQIIIRDCDNTVKLIVIFDKNGSVFEQECINNCGCGFNCGSGCGGNNGFNGGCGCGSGIFGLAALALLFCC